MGDNNNQIVATTIRRRLQAVPLLDPQCCIGRVPDQRDANEFYAPKVVSIGPLHRQIQSSEERAIELEHQKSCYLRSFLELNQELKIEDYIKSLHYLEGQSRRCYGGKILCDSNKFMEILMVDGCFIIVLFLKFMAEVPRDTKDPIFNDAQLLNNVRHDLLLFQNQIPFVALQNLFNTAGVFNGGPSLVELALNFFNPIIPGHRELIPAECVEIKHLLDLIRRSYAPSLSEIQPLENPSPMHLDYGAWDLQDKAAVRFKKSNKGKSLLDIKFRSDAVMEIPPLNIQAGTLSIFLNLIAYEQYCGGPDSYITDYVSFMASLVKNPGDAGLLTKYGIFENYFPEAIRFDTHVYESFRILRSKCVLRKSHYSKICKKVKRHCDSTWRVWLATFWFKLLSLQPVLPFGLAEILVVWFIIYIFSFF